jgi:glycosyltransferase involved in cell wall biosynthesis
VNPEAVPPARLVGRTTDPQLVSVVIPAYNAAATLDETLRSVRSQTHRALEIIVVDDGSTDDTRAIAERHAAIDQRVQVVSQDNAGVAAARNTGWRRARSDLIAFLDADDLCAPTRIERQAQVMQQRGQRVGLVYCWYFRIDSQGLITSVPQGVQFEGDVLDQLCVRNIVGNGSSALIRRQALIDAHGFDSRLRAAGAEGCEDYLLYFRVAERYHFAVVPEPLVGYRQLPNSMCRNRVPMLRSWLIVLEEIMARHPDHRDDVNRALRRYGAALAHEGLSIAGFKNFPPLWRVLFRWDPAMAMQLLLEDVPLTLIRKVAGRLRRLFREAEKPISAQIYQRFPVGDLD